MIKDNEFVADPEELDPSLADPEIEGTAGIGGVSQPVTVTPEVPEVQQ